MVGGWGIHVRFVFLAFFLGDVIMMISAFFRHKTNDRVYWFNPMNVLYIDEDGVLFAPDVYRLFADGEYEQVLNQMTRYKMIMST